MLWERTGKKQERSLKGSNFAQGSSLSMDQGSEEGLQGVEIWKLRRLVGPARTELRMLMRWLPSGKTRRHSQ